MKKLILLFFSLSLLQFYSCSRLTVSKISSVRTGLKTRQSFANDTLTYKIWGDTIVKQWQAEINKIGSATNNAGVSLLIAGIISTGLGTIGGVVNNGLSVMDAKNVSYGISIASALIGVYELIVSTKKDSKNYVNEANAVLIAWNKSKKDKPDFDTLLDSLQTIRGKYGYPTNIDINEPPN